jgi:hypothetical protein
MKKKTLLIAVVAIVLAAIAAASVTVAWLTAEANEVTNTFTVGNITIDLKEYILGDKTQEKTASAEGNYKVVPGGTQEKEPFVKVKGGSEKCYVYVLVTNELAVTNDKGTTYTNVATLDIGGKWESIATVTTNGVVKTLYRYTEVVDALGTASTEWVKTDAVFTNVKYAGDAITSTNITQLDDKQIKIDAFAHQSDNTTSNVADKAAKVHFGFEAAN